MAVSEREQRINIGAEIVGGIHTPGEEAADCDQFTRGLARAAQRDGVSLQLATEFSGLRTKGLRVLAAQTSQGDIEADAFVVCLGFQSQPMLAALGVHVPVYPLKGYSLTLPNATAVLAHAMSPPNGGITTARRIETFGWASTKVTSVCHALARYG